MCILPCARIQRHRWVRALCAAQVLAGESWTKQTVAILSFINTALRAGAYIAKYVGGSLFSKA